MKLSSVAKFLDQPLLSNTLSRKMPCILTCAAAIYGIKDTFEQPKDNRKKQAIKNLMILGSITLASILGGKFIKINGQSLIETIPKEKILLQQRSAISEFLANNPVNSNKISGILEKAKNKILNLKDTDTLLNELKGKMSAQKLIDALFGKGEEINSSKILQEISKLSIMGFIPVASGILGGIAADKITGDLTKEKTTNKIKEGIYQFFANIFLCNVGAGTFLYTAEKLNDAGVIKNFTPLKKTLVILAGILSVGVLGGSYIANFIGNKLVNPILDKNPQNNKESRKPEPIDIALHTDDIATAGVLSGLKWIEPLLPVMYLISGYRAATGYRNTSNNAHSALTNTRNITIIKK